jgi:hypothetical protein
MLLGLAKPDAGTVTVFGRPPRDAVDAGLVGAMLQSGELIRDGIPLIFYWIIAGPKHNQHISGTPFTWGLYYMVGLASFGTMISTGARIAGERQAGWTRQLQISPLSVRAYFRSPRSAS